MQRSAQNVTCTFCAHSNYIAIAGRLADKLRKMLSDCGDDGWERGSFWQKSGGTSQILSKCNQVKCNTAFLIHGNLEEGEFKARVAKATTK